MLESFFEWMSRTAIAQALGMSAWAYAIIQAFHLVALAIFFGAVLIVDLRLMGWVLKDRPVADVARDARPWFIGGFLALVATGVPQMMQNAMREYYSEYFWFKMWVLLFALILAVTIRRKVAFSDQARTGGLLPKLVGFASAVMWIAVAA